jgi:ribokinase
MTAQVIVVGSLNMDLVVRTPRIPVPGETIIGRDFHTLPGGKGANQAVAAARVGGRVTMVGRLGQDDFGQALRRNLEAANIDQTYLSMDDTAATGVALIEVDDAAQNSIVVASGANMQLTPTHVEAAAQAIAKADVLLLQLEVPLETCIRAAEIAQQQQTTVILNPAPAQTLPEHFLRLVDILIPNESETALLTQASIANQDDLAAAAQQLRAWGVKTIILTLGEQGALLADETGISLHPTFPVTPIDTTAAGDAFVGGFAVALAEGRPQSEAIRWGNATGALATTQLGAQPSLPTRQQVEALV